MKPRNKSQQIISATNGAVIENVTQQIIYSGKPDKDFSINTAKALPNLVNQEIVINRIKEASSKYFWKPPNIETSLSNIKMQGYSVPVWRFKGYVYVTWSHLVTTSRQVGETKVEESHPREESKQLYFDWLVPSVSESSPHVAKILEGFVAVNSGKSAVQVAWKLPGMGRIVSNFQLLFRRNKENVENAGTMFEDPIGLPKHIKRDNTSPRSLDDLQPNITLNNALTRLNSQLELHLRNTIGTRSSIQRFQQKIQIEMIEEYRLPVWLIIYKYNRENRFATFNGYSAKLINLLLPVSFRAEILAFFISLLVWLGASHLVSWIFIGITNSMFGSYLYWLTIGCMMSFPLLLGIALMVNFKIPNREIK